MEQTSFALESVQDSVVTVRAMKAASKELRTAFKSKDLDINSIEQMNDEMADLLVTDQNGQSVCCEMPLFITCKTWLAL